ncbi:MAG TPA: tetratricopeptide repeat protein [Anaerolineae bacterium]|nr:tetratricopeptide repeat protein [Anaerolineae bacterium]
MDVLTTDLLPEVWPGVFRQLIITNSRYWLNCAQTDPDHFVRELPQTLRALNYGLAIPEAWESSRDLMRCLNDVMMRRGQGIEWETYLAQGIARSSQLDDPVEIEFRLYLGNLYRLQGRLSETRNMLQPGLERCAQYNTRQHYWALLNLLALTARLAGRHDEALARCRQVLDSSEPSIAEQAEAHSITGLVGYDRGDWDVALTSVEQALQLYRALNNNFEMARMLTNKGVMLQHRGRIFQNAEWIDQAEECNEEAIRRFDLAGDHSEIFKPVMNLGNIYLLREYYQAAISQYKKAMPHFQDHHYVIDLAFTYNNLGLAYIGLEEWQTAEDYFSASVNIWQTLGVPHKLVNVLDNLGSLFIKTNETEKARETLTEALALLDELADSSETLRLRNVILNRLAQINEA